ncbi:MAG: S-layer homology domain-containing protein [Oscillibacter sp.]|nr:S-layer homology domain-containing protein [Oscillibacter sp.]
MTTAQKKTAVQRLGAALLSFAMLLSLFWMTERPAKAADWMEPYLDQVVEWGVMRGDATGNLNADRQITRAEFVTLINRAFGYTEAGPNPFTDVLESDWFAEDIAIAHQAGYFNGTSPTTAAPYNLVTREQAAALLGRSLRLQGTTGSASSFTDGNEIGTWSRGLVQQAADMGIIQGYPDGSFRPDALITRGQVACFLVRALGTLVNEPGEQTSGGVYGNLTINTAGVKLKDTTITGNLYLTGGVGLGNVELENVTVLGEIVLCGAGEAERGENSVVLRNVTADSMVIDSLTDQFLSVRAEGLTDIGNTTVRTGSYLEDVTDDGLGLKVITLDGASGTQLQVAGNIKEIVNLTPNSNLQIAQGVAGTVTMDEKATGGRLNIDGSASIRDLNLDTATPVTGTGSISHVNVNAAGSNIAMLPDTIYVRPGINSNINRTDMDTTAAAESSEDPRLLSGYPFINNVAPTSAQAIFSTNKAGTIYWVLSTLTDGSMGENELLNPSAYASRILRSGTISAAASKTEYTARLTGLTRDGSYYVSAMLVDNRGRHSPVKVAAFTTPDDTTPAFASGYPTTIMTEDEDGEQVVQVMTMPTKDCQMYYALLPNNAAAPSTADLKAGAVTGNLGYGVVDVKKNTPLLVPKVNTSYLQEQTTYNLYLWLNDADNGKSSAIRRLQVTTLDKTPPTITHLTHVESAARSATFTVALDEPGTLYWAVVKANNRFYALNESGQSPTPEELVAKIQIENGTNAVRSGRVNVARAATDVRFNITGLEAQTHYDLYYVAKDRAGNYNIYTENLTPPMEFSTLDNEPPTVVQEFTHDGTDEGQKISTPYPDTDINLVFSESVQGIEYINGVAHKDVFLDLYTAVDRAPDGSEAEREAQVKLGQALRKYITLNYRPASGQPVPVNVKGDQDVGDNWVIDYSKAIVRPDPEGTGELIISFPTDKDNPENGALKLGSGVTYYFTLTGIADTSPAMNAMKGTRGVVTLPNFTTIDAQLVFSGGSSSGNGITFDMNFRLTPVTTQNSSSDTLWDMIFWSNATVAFEMYYRDLPNGNWTKITAPDREEMRISTTTQHPTTGLSFSKFLKTAEGAADINFDQLRSFQNDREYGIVITEWNGTRDRGTWSGETSLTITPVAGDYTALTNLANKTLSRSSYAEHQKGIYAVKEIGVPKEYTVSKPHEDTQPPTFVEQTPTIVPGDTGVEINFMVSRNNCKYYCVITKVGNLSTTLKGSNGGQDISIDKTNWDRLPESGKEIMDLKDGNLRYPSKSSMTDGSITGPAYVVREGSCGRQLQTISIRDELEPESEYIAYFVLQGESMTSLSDTYGFRFKTETVVRPVIRVGANAATANVTADRVADVRYVLLVDGRVPSLFLTPMKDNMVEGAANMDGYSARYENMTILEAMSDYVRRGNSQTVLGSVFDLFANQDIKNQVVNFMDTARGDGSSVMLVGNMAHKGNNDAQSVDCQNSMIKNNDTMTYWFVAMGKSPQGSGYAFAAAPDLYYPNTTPPQVLSIATTIDDAITGNLQDNPTDASRMTYTGTVTITFSTDLYYLSSSGGSQYLQVVDKSIADLGTDAQSRGYISSAALITSPNVSVEHRQGGSNTSPCSTLTLRYTASGGGGAAITFDRRLANSRGITGNQALTLTMTLVPNNNGMYVPRFSLPTSLTEWGRPSVTP